MTQSLFEQPPLQTRGLLTIIKVLHTAVWAFFATCIMALPLAALLRRFDWALILTALALIECCALAINRGRCPLTNLAAKFTTDRSEAFDIYLPVWLARWNKTLFGTLFILSELFLLWQRLR
jgi:hypothetical protein